MNDTTKEHILRSAVELFSEQGYDGTTIRDICCSAGANVAAVNYHFKGKSGLGEAVIDHLFENIAETKKVMIGADSISTESEWKQAIRKFIHNFIADRDKEEYRNFFRSRLIFRELNTPSPLFESMFKKYLGPLQEHLKVLIKQGLPPDSDNKTISMWIITLMSQCVMFRKKQVAPMGMEPIDFSDAENVEMVVNHIAETLFAGLKFRK